MMKDEADIDQSLSQKEELQAIHEETKDEIKNWIQKQGRYPLGSKVPVLCK